MTCFRPYLFVANKTIHRISMILFKMFLKKLSCLGRRTMIDMYVLLDRDLRIRSIDNPNTYMIDSVFHFVYLDLTMSTKKNEPATPIKEKQHN